MKSFTTFSFVLCISLCVLTITALGQIQTPAPSPYSELHQTVGLTDVEINYSRPGMKGRTIFGGLVDYGKIWRTGANQATTISFSDDVKLGGKEVPKGTYAIYTMPGKDEWTVMIYKDTKIGGNVARYKESDELTRFMVKPEKMSFPVETMTFMINDITSNSAVIYLVWDKTSVPMKLEVEVEKRVMANIDRVMSGPSGGDYFQAASYYYANDKDMGKALTWVNKSLEAGERFWIMTLKARILGKMGKAKEAIATSEKAMKMAEEAKNSDYVKINKELIAKMKGM